MHVLLTQILDYNLRISELQRKYMAQYFHSKSEPLNGKGIVRIIHRRLWFIYKYGQLRRCNSKFKTNHIFNQFSEFVMPDNNTFHHNKNETLSNNRSDVIYHLILKLVI